MVPLRWYKHNTLVLESSGYSCWTLPWHGSYNNDYSVVVPSHRYGCSKLCYFNKKDYDAIFYHYNIIWIIRHTYAKNGGTARKQQLTKKCLQASETLLLQFKRESASLSFSYLTLSHSFSSLPLSHSFSSLPLSASLVHLLQAFLMQLKVAIFIGPSSKVPFYLFIVEVHFQGKIRSIGDN